MLRTLGLLASVIVFSSLQLWPRVSARPLSYPLVTIVFGAILVASAIWWRLSASDQDSPLRFADQRPFSIAVALSAALVVAYVAARWVHEISWNAPVADMLIVIREAVRRFLRGHDPYTIYRTYDAPWDMVMPYGPLLWGPYTLAFVLRLDLRAVTIIGELMVPIWCGVVAAIEAQRGRIASALAWLALLAALVTSLDVARFSLMGHTPVYWPLLLMLAATLTRRNWFAAAFVVGLLVTARSTMIAIVPVFAIAVWVAAPRRLGASILIVLGTITALMLPFLLWDHQSLWSNMVASYPRLMKQIIWTSPGREGVDTIGVTGVLLSHRWERFVEPLQVASLALTIGVSWFAIRKGARPLPWMALALLAFSMTSLWPVFYIYYDVILLLASGAIAETLEGSWASLRWRNWATTLATAAGIVIVSLIGISSAQPTVSVGDPGASRFVRYGFAPLESDAGRTFAWAVDSRVRMVVPRGSAATSDIEIECRPFVAEGGAPQTVAAILNGSLLGTIPLAAGWQTIRFRATRDRWWVGYNDLELSFSSAESPRDTGVSDDPRRLAVAIERVAVTPATATASPAP